jgi:uncharacterized membrane protein
MTDRTEPVQDQVDSYLVALRQQLSGLPAEDVDEILRELRGHILERAAASDSGQSQTPVEQILRQLGTPEQIGSLYRADALVAHARASFSPALIIRTTIRWASKTGLGFSAFLAGVMGYALGAALIVCAILKPIFPASVGLWISRHGILLGAEMPRPPLGRELLGWWIIPYGLVIGSSFLLGTTVFLRWMLRFIPSASRRVASRSMQARVAA